MIQHWSYVEADFQREYRIDLAGELDKLTWRKFLALLRGLSPQSCVALLSSNEEAIRQRQAEQSPENQPAELQQVYQDFWNGFL